MKQTKCPNLAVCPNIPDFNVDLVYYKFKRIVEMPSFPDQFNGYKRVGYNSECLVYNP